MLMSTVERDHTDGSLPITIILDSARSGSDSTSPMNPMLCQQISVTSLERMSSFIVSGVRALL